MSFSQSLRLCLALCWSFSQSREIVFGPMCCQITLTGCWWRSATLFIFICCCIAALSLSLSLSFLFAHTSLAHTQHMWKPFSRYCCTDLLCTMHTHTRTHAALMHTHIHIHTHTHTHIHTHTHTLTHRMYKRYLPRAARMLTLTLSSVRERTIDRTAQRTLVTRCLGRLFSGLSFLFPLRRIDLCCLFYLLLEFALRCSLSFFSLFCRNASVHSLHSSLPLVAAGFAPHESKSEHAVLPPPTSACYRQGAALAVQVVMFAVGVCVLF